MKLLKSGFDVLVCSRQKESHILSKMGLPVIPISVDLNQKEIPKAALENVSFVVHLAGDGVADKKWTTERKKQILDSRVHTTLNLFNSLKGLKKLERVISASAIGFYPMTPNDDKAAGFVETDINGTGFLSEVCQSWENSARESGKKMGVPVSIIRIGLVLKRGAGFLSKLEPLARRGLLSWFGKGQAIGSWIHIEDLLAAIEFIIKSKNPSQTYNLTSPSPVSNKKMIQALAKSMNTSPSLPVPEMAIRLAMGSMAEMILGSQKVIPKNLLDEGFAFQFATLEKAFENLYREHPEAHVFEDRVWLSLEQKKVFEFFADEGNLEKITPSILSFSVVGKSTEKIEKGTLIDYRLKIHGVPAKWRTEITSWQPPIEFVDEQFKGPYSLWHHRHSFETLNGGTLIQDKVHYRLPVGVLGDLFGSGLVKSDVEKIFEFRQQSVLKLIK
jgi:uncharacterized protein (TIGR01777 family)